MKHKKINRWFASIAILGSMIIGVAYLLMPAVAAQEVPHGPPALEKDGVRGRVGPASGFERWRMMRQLDLTEEQKEQIKELRKAQFEQTRDEREAFRSAEKQFREAVKAFENGEVGDDLVYLTSVMLAEARADVAIARSGNRSAFLEILTPDQQQRLEELRTEMREFHTERRERRKEFMKNLGDEKQASPNQVF
jgi:protein CpxP